MPLVYNVDCFCRFNFNLCIGLDLYVDYGMEYAYLGASTTILFKKNTFCNTKKLQASRACDTLPVNFIFWVNHCCMHTYSKYIAFLIFSFFLSKLK